MSGRRRRKSSPQRSNNSAPGVEFWGRDVDDDAEPEPIVVSDQPAAMVRSLGRPPLAGNDQAAEATFEVVYGRAALLAGALADSVGLLRQAGDD